MAPRASYGAPIPAETSGTIASVDEGSPAARAGLRPGDRILSANGEPLRDILDWQWHSEGAAVELGVLAPDGDAPRSVELKRLPGEPWGIEFVSALFDGVRVCRNNCAFCFMTQLPKGLRPALYLRDDDYRLSFLQGNFITLTNLSDGDVERIAEQQLSPLYVSLHAVDPEVRRQLVCAREDRALDRFDELIEAGIDVHTQIVLVPGINDGDVLERTLRWLAEREGVLSVGIVPLGYTAHQSRFSASYLGPSAAAVIDQVVPWQKAFRQRDGVTWAFLADEFYLSAAREVPPAEEYDDFPQYENGIGLVRSFLDEASTIAEELRAVIGMLPAESHIASLSGELFAPVLERVVRPLDPNGRIVVLPVANEFFGGNVSVTGLLTARDICAALERTAGFSAILVPDVVLNADGVTLDDLTPEDIAACSGEDVRLISCDAGGLLTALRALVQDDPRR